MSLIKAPLRAGVIGLGHMGRWHLQKYLDLEPKIQVVGFYDSHKSHEKDLKLPTALNLKKAKTLKASSEKLTCFSSLESLAEEVDLVTVATPANTHFPIVKTLLEKGIHVLVEKPLATHLEEGELLVRLSKEKNLVLAVGYSERCHPLLLQALPYLKQMKRMYFYRWTQPSTRGKDVNVLLDLMVHDLDILCKLWGSEKSFLEKVQILKLDGQFDGESVLNTASVELLLPTGQTVILKASRASKQAFRFCFGLNQEQQVLLDFANHYLRVDGRDASTGVGTGTRIGPDAHVDVDFDFNVETKVKVNAKVNTNTKAGTRAGLNTSTNTSAMEESSLKEQKLQDPPDNLMTEVSQFVETLRGQSQPVVSGRESLGSLFLAQTIQSLWKEQK